ncbi:mannanase [Aquisalinus flavus]|uniref:mannan endo-1,4-beta-mannosidase n=2 Tax=Aquisalinus flavus TaxID=1526572 RepID=A0A8J2V732_9PROT|nr:mannanase [Aquisalinus flavus]
MIVNKLARPFAILAAAGLMACSEPAQPETNAGTPAITAGSGAPVDPERGGMAETLEESAFVAVDGMRFTLEGEDYAYVGANMWYGAYLGADTDYGDRDRLIRELDFLKANGVTNLRVLGSSELSPLDNSVRPTFRDETGAYNEELLIGLDFLLAEMGKREMKAVIYLNNFWEWSGGMVTYLYWTNGGEFINLGDPAHPWPAFAVFSAGFYRSEAANELYRDYIDTLVTRTNTITGILYTDDSAIMAWQLANEPRSGGGTPEEEQYLPDFFAWIDDTAGYIKSLDPNHLVSSGNEGSMGCGGSMGCFIEAHDTDNIDYLTFHMWPKNWGWMDATDMEGTWDRTATSAMDYIETHIDVAREMDRPLVLEEFGFDRDGGSFDKAAGTEYRDRFYTMVFDRIEESVAGGGPLVGSNFWSWGGYGEAAHDDYLWQNGDKSYTGDPPQEQQGLNSIFAGDDTTITVLSGHAETLERLTE